MDTKLTFEVKRQPPQFIIPAKPTPTDRKPLSDLDDREGLRYQLSGVQIYPSDPSMKNKDPVKVIREALAHTLVFYYPFAGRLREGPNRKLTVDCTGEGVIFIEADAGVRVEEFGESLHPPFPCMDELLCYEGMSGSQGILNSPLMVIQVTRLLCGGFIFAIRFTHTICDAFGMSQFLTAIADICRGASSPSILPIWKRSILNARNPPQITFSHPEFLDIPNIIPPTKTPTQNNIKYKSFLFNPTKISALRKQIPPRLTKCTTFDLLAASVWRSRTIALQINPNQKVRIVFPLNARSRLNPHLPEGYYGNVFVLPGAISTAYELSNKPMAYALELVMKAKANVTEEYVRSFIDLTVAKGRAPISMEWTYIVDDLTRVGLWDMDYGWGKPVYGGMAYCEVDSTPGTGNYFLRIRNENGDGDEIVAPMCLPASAMERFEVELEKLFLDGNGNELNLTCKTVRSAL